MAAPEGEVGTADQDGGLFLQHGGQDGGCHLNDDYHRPSETFFARVRAEADLLSMTGTDLASEFFQLFHLKFD